MQLAARAALLYLNHAVLAKARGRLTLPVTVRFADAAPELQVARVRVRVSCRWRHVT